VCINRGRNRSDSGGAAKDGVHAVGLRIVAYDPAPWQNFVMLVSLTTNYSWSPGQ